MSLPATADGKRPRRMLASGTPGASSSVFIVSLFLLLAPALPAGASGRQSASAPADLAEGLLRIQTTCFDLYPPALVELMSGRPGPVPAEVRADPRLQVKYLKTEERVAKGLFYPSILEDLLPALRTYVRPDTRFLDLGSGDGRVVFMAALLGGRASGIEYDREMHRIALKARDRLRDLIDVDRAALRRGDFFKENLSSYDVYFYYAGGSSMERRLLSRVRDAMSPSAVLVIAYERDELEDFEKIADFDGVVAFRRRP